MHNKLEKQYYENVIMPEIEQKNRILESIHHRTRSLKFDELKRHESMLINILWKNSLKLKKYRIIYTKS